MTSKSAPTWRPDEFTPPGVVRVSQAALELARAFGEEARRVMPGKDWIVTFGWFLSQRVRRPDSSWEDFGAGLDVGALERWQIPADRVETVDGFEFAIQIPSDVCNAAVERLIDRDDTVLTKLTLR